MIKGNNIARFAIHDQWFAIVVPQEKPCFRIQKDRRIGKACKIGQIYFACFDQTINERQNETSIRAGRNSDPFIGNRIVSSTNWVHTDNTRAAFFDFANAHFDWVTVVIFGHAKQHE